MRPAPYQAPGSARFFLHVAIVALIGAGVLATTALSSAIPGSASSGSPDLLESASGIDTISPVTARFAQTSIEQQALDKQLQPQPPADSLLLAVLSLESSTTSSEVESSVQRILDLGVPQETPPHAALQAIENEPEDDAAGEDATDDTTPDESNQESGEDPAGCTDSGSPAYCVYTVVEGDTLSAIAQNMGFAGNDSISAAEMLAQSNKPDVVSSDHIEPGQNIRVPRQSGILHTVLFAETASEIAADYGVTVDALLGSPYNAIGGDGIVVIGQTVFIPAPTQLPVNEDVELTLGEDPPEPEATATETPAEEPAAEPTATEEPTATSEPVLPPDIPLLGDLDTPTPVPSPTQTPTNTPEPDDEDESEPAPGSTPPAPSGSSRFIWPVAGPISSYYGPSHPLGIDIDLFDNPSASIAAARGGTVVFAGGDPCCSYGFYVIVDHGNGVQTLYAHLSRIVVSEGDVVSQGDLLGIGGRTGYATGNHLHFEIRVDGNVVDPMRYLP